MPRKKAEVKIKMICEKCGNHRSQVLTNQQLIGMYMTVMKNVNVVENS